mmetsp:Transcript_3253/g.9717  ORF Transcript_3253/g.9717 Transcript_3253/m.9717 type:complete len:311 (-) Transcript_3253:1523-2455(-)
MHYLRQGRRPSACDVNSRNCVNWRLSTRLLLQHPLPTPGKSPPRQRLQLQLRPQLRLPRRQHGPTQRSTGPQKRHLHILLCVGQGLQPGQCQQRSALQPRSQQLLRNPERRPDSQQLRTPLWSLRSLRRSPYCRRLQPRRLLLFGQLARMQRTCGWRGSSAASVQWLRGSLARCSGFMVSRLAWPQLLESTEKTMQSREWSRQPLESTESTCSRDCPLSPWWLVLVVTAIPWAEPLHRRLDRTRGSSWSRSCSLLPKAGVKPRSGLDGGTGASKTTRSRSASWRCVSANSRSWSARRRSSTSASGSAKVL